MHVLRQAGRKDKIRPAGRKKRGVRYLLLRHKMLSGHEALYRTYLEKEICAVSGGGSSYTYESCDPWIKVTVSSHVSAYDGAWGGLHDLPVPLCDELVF